GGEARRARHGPQHTTRRLRRALRNPPCAPIVDAMSARAISTDDLRRELEGICGPRRVSTRDGDLDVYARDMWPRLLFARRDGVPAGHRPHAVVWPETVREVVALVRLAREVKLPIVPYGGGSGVCGGAVPIRGGITIDLKRMTTLRGVSPDELVCDVDAG